MQKLKLTLFTFTSVLVLASCNSPRTNKEVAAKTKNNSAPVFTSGAWHVSNFIKDGVDGKDKYASYVFEFTPDNHITATQGNHTYKGNWKVISDGTTDDAPTRDLDIIISFKKQDSISQLNGEWMIEEKTPLSVDLSNVSSNHDKVDRLAFQKG